MDSQSQQQQRMEDSRTKYKKYCVIFGAFLIFIPTGISNLWGNMSVYIYSYFYVEHGFIGGLQTPWVLSTFIISLNIGISAGGLLFFWKPSFLIFLGIMFNCVGIFALYFATTFGIAPLFYSGIALTGFCIGSLDSIVFKRVAEWSDSRKGCLISIASAGIQFGPSIMNPFVSMYINPDNLSPDSKLGTLEMFTQNNIIQNVPSVFLILGAFLFVCQMVGLVMLSQKQDTKNSSVGNRVRYGTVTSQEENTNKKTDSERQEQHVDKGVSSGSEETTESQMTFSSKTDFSPMQCLKCHVFQILWSSYVFISFTDMFVKNYYKTFGQIWIKNDHFLATMGSFISIGGGLTMLIWGLALDKFSIKTCLMFVYSTACYLFLLMYFAPLINKWLYFFVTVLLQSILSCVYPTMITVIMTYFGLKHFNGNLGLLSTSMLVVNFVAPPIFERLLRTHGWFSLFCFSASFDFVGLCAITWKFPKPDSKTNDE